MSWILGIGALICAVYYIVIIVYSGITTSASIIWPLMAAFLGTGFAVFKYRRTYLKQLPLWVPVSGLTLCVAGLLVLVIVEILIFSGLSGPVQQNLDYVIVLGTKVKGKEVSNSLKKRLDKAIEYSEQNPDTILVLSGGKGPGEDVTEARAMYDYLVYNGVSPEQLILEEVSESTVENIAYSKVAIERYMESSKQEAKEQFSTGPIAPGPFMVAQDKPVQIGVITSNFHVYRAKKIGEKWGLPELYGIPAESDWILFPHLCVRECLAI